MALFEVHEERIYYVRANSKSQAEEIYGNAHPTDAASAEVTEVKRIKNESISAGDTVLDGKWF